MDSSANYPELLRSSMKKGAKKQKSWKSTDNKVDPSFLRDMGYSDKKKKKGKPQ